LKTLLSLILAAAAGGEEDIEAGVRAAEARAAEALLAGTRRASPADARRAAELVRRLDPGNAAAAEILSRPEPGAKPADPPSEPEFTSVFNGRSLRGLEGKGGAFVVKDGRVTGDSGGTPAFLLLSRRPPRECDLRATLTAGGAGGAGLVVGRSRGRGVALLLLPRSGTVLRDLSTGADLATGPAAGGGATRVELKVLGTTVRGFVDGRLAVEAELEGPLSGDAGIVRVGSATVEEIGVRPSFAADLVAAAASALASGKAPEAMAAASALEREGAAAEAALARGAALALLSRLEEGSAELARGRAALAGRRSPPDARLRKLADAAEAAEKRVRERRDAVDAPFREAVAAVRAGSIRALETDRADLALTLATRLESLLPNDRSARFLRLRAYGRARGKDGVIALFDGTTLSGWTLSEEGTFVLKDGALHAPSASAARDAVRADIEGYPRALLEAEFHAGSVYEAGLVVGGAEDGYCLALRNVFHEREFIVRRKGGEVKMRRDLGEIVPPGDGSWHRLGAFVHRNRVTIFVDGRKVLEKVFSRPLEGCPGVYVAENTVASFRDVTFRIFDDDRETERFLYEKGLDDRVVLEAEEAVETGLVGPGASVSTVPLAFGGADLTLGGERAQAPFAEYVFDSPSSWKSARLDLRYRRPPEGKEPALVATIDGGAVEAEIALPSTGSRDYGTVTAELGPLSPGEHVLRVSPKSAADAPSIDRLVVRGDTAPAAEPSRLLTSEKHPLLAIQTSPGVNLEGDVEGLFEMVDDLRGYMSEYLGVTIDRPLTLSVVSRECWGDPHLGGYATGRALFVPEETVFRDLATVAHELSHCFDFGQGFVPPWLGEGKSVPVFVDFMAERGDKYRWNALGGVDARARMGRGSRKLLLGDDGTTLLQWWGTDRFSYGEHPQRGAAYDASAYLCADLREIYGKEFWRTFHALVKKDLDAGTYFMPAGDRVAENSALVQYLSRAAGEDLSRYFRDAGFTIRELARAGETLVASTSRDDPYLTRGGGSRFSPGGDGEPPGRILESGSDMIFTFPLSSDATEVEVLVRASGRGRAFVDGGGEATSFDRPPSGGPGIVVEATVSDPAALEDGRLHVTLSAGAGGAVTVTGVSVRPVAR